MLVAPGDAKALGAAVARLLKDPLLRARYGHAGRARVERHFGVDRLVEGTMAVYQAVTSGARAAPAGSSRA